MRLLLLAAAASLALAAPAAATPADDLRVIIDEHWAWFLRNNPVYASALGVRDHEGELGEFSLAAQDRQAREAQALVERLDAIPADRLTPRDRANAAILRRNLMETVEANRFGQRQILYSNRGG